MSNWVQITRDEVLAYQPEGFISAIESEGNGTIDPLQQAIINITRSVRLAVKSGNYRLDIDTRKIPAELTAEAIALIVEFSKQKILTALTDDEVRLANAARDKLLLVSQGKLFISSPDESQNGNGRSKGKVIGLPTRTFSNPPKLHT